MSKNKLSVFCFIIGITTISISYLSAQDCVDDVTDAFAAFGGCAVMAPGMNCAGVFAGTLVTEECPVYCDACPGVCGTGVCEFNETYLTCPDDCEPPPLCDGPVCLDITNVHPDAKTYDVIMTNQTGCNYCSGGQGGSSESVCTGAEGIWTFDHTIDAQTCAGVCSNSLDPNGTTVSQYYNKDVCRKETNGLCSNPIYSSKSTCEAAGTCVGADSDADGEPDETQPTTEDECLDPTGDGTGTAGEFTPKEPSTWEVNTWTDSDINGFYFDGNVYGFQFVISNASMTLDTDAVTGGYALDEGFTISTQPNYDLDGPSLSEHAEDPTLTMLLGFSLDGDFIPPGEKTILTIAFTDYTNDAICFNAPNCEGSGCNNIISDKAGNIPLDTDYSPCYCSGGAVADCANDCLGVLAYDCTFNEFADDNSASCGGDAIDYNGAEVAGCGELAISQIGSNLPEIFSISQNFPNPFNPVTSIIFDVAEMDEVSLVVYDLTGKEVATLVSGTYTPGTYNVEWNAVNNVGDGIASGMYIYRYISSDKAITRKMLYLK